METAPAKIPTPSGRTRSPKAFQLKAVVEKNVFSRTQEATAKDGTASRASRQNTVDEAWTGGEVLMGL